MNSKSKKFSNRNKRGLLTAGELYSFKIVEPKSGGFGISIDGKDLLTPFRDPFWTPSLTYCQWVIDRLAEGGKEHFSGSQALLCHECTFFIGFSNGIANSSNHDLGIFRSSFISCAARDPIHALCAGPEVVEQMARLAPFYRYCKDRGIRSPSFPQSNSISETFLDKEDSSVQRYFKTLEKDFQSLSLGQLAVVHTYYLYGSSYQGRPTVLPMLLVKGLCSPKEFAEGILASLCIIPGVFEDVSETEFQQLRKRLQRDAEYALFFLGYH